MAPRSKASGMTKEQIDFIVTEAKRINAEQGTSIPKLAVKFGVGECWLRRRIVPGYREQENERVRKRLYGARDYGFNQ